MIGIERFERFWDVSASNSKTKSFKIKDIIQDAALNHRIFEASIQSMQDEGNKIL